MSGISYVFHNREWFSEVAISMSSEESDDYIRPTEVRSYFDRKLS